MTHFARILWFDLEMSGLDSGSDLILEVAAIATDWDFKELGTYEGIVKNEEAALQERVRANGAFWDQHPQARDGLIRQNAEGRGLQEVEDDLLAFIDRHFEQGKPVLLGGNSVHIDRQFVMRNWPRLDARLHYRMCDVTAWKVVFEGKYGKHLPKPDAHRALEDIRGSINELKYYLGKVKI